MLETWTKRRGWNGQQTAPMNGFRWPEPGDKAFGTSPHWQENAYIDPFGHGRLVMMIEGYKKAADLMVEEIIRSRFEGSALVFPIVFNYRQFIELELKYFTSTYGPAFGVQPNWQTHDLSVLWDLYLEVYDHYDEVQGTDKIVASIIREFATIDPQSFAFRYPVDKRGGVVALPHDQIDVRGMAEAMHGLHGYFSGVDGYLSELRSAMNDIKKDSDP